MSVDSQPPKKSDDEDVEKKDDDKTVRSAGNDDDDEPKAASEEAEEAPKKKTKKARPAEPEVTIARTRKVEKRPKATIWQRATYRWSAITAVMATLLVIYTQHPYYKGGQFAPWRSLYPIAFVTWLVLGIPYCKATLEKFNTTRYTMRDGGLHLILLAKAFQEKRFWRVAKNPRIRTTLLAICVKSFFTPLMTGFFSGHANAIADAWLRHKHLPVLKFTMHGGLPWNVAAEWWSQVGSRLGDLVPSGKDIAGLFSPGTWTRSDLSWGLQLGYDFVFFVDCGWALMGYSSESRWLGNKTRSVEPTAFGWAVCLACYPPYNNVLGTYLPLEGGPSHFNAKWLVEMWPAAPMDLPLYFKAATVALFTIYSAATVAFGFKFSNLTNRGVVSRGPYRFVRHPAYLTKCSAWWLEHIPTLTLQKAFFLSLLCGVYALRAWTEERHLSKDPDYRAYKKKTPWVLFPGLY